MADHTAELQIITPPTNHYREGLGVTQPHSLSGLRVVLEGLGLGASASPIVGYDGHNSWVLRHQGWGEGNDPAAVDCWQFWSIYYHCLQQSSQFKLSEGMVCMRAGGKVVTSCSAGRVVAWATGGGGAGGGSNRSANGGANSRRLEGGWTAALGGSNKGAARGCSQCSREAGREGCSQCSRRGLSVTQPHSLSGLRVVLEGLGLGATASPIMGLRHNSWVLEHQSWGEGNDPAAVDCWHGTCCPSYHCLQRSSQFEMGERMVCMRAGGKVVVSCGAGWVAAWSAGGGGTGGGSNRSANGGARSCKLQEATAEPAQPVTTSPESQIFEGNERKRSM